VNQLEFLDSNSPEQTKLLHDILDLGITFNNQKNVCHGRQRIPEFVDFSPPPTGGIPAAQLKVEFARIARRSSNFASPRFVGFPDSGNSIAGLSASVMIPFLNQNLINQDFCAPEATFVEMETIHWLRDLAGYKPAKRYHQALDIGGCSVNGGVGANSTAMLAAREALYPGSMRMGLKIDPVRIKVLVPAGISHYSIRMSLAWLGLGETNITEVQVDQKHRMNLEKLEQTIKDQRALGHSIMACVVYAGDSRTMTIDNLRSVGQILTRFGIWFHVDACHGVQLFFSSNSRHKLEGIELADSITVDPHKVLWVPYVCSYVLFKNPAILRTINSSSDLITKEKWSLGQTTPFIGSKAFNSLKFWAVIKHLGTKRIGELIDQRITLRRKIQHLVKQNKCLLLVNNTDINSTMFMYVPIHLQNREQEIGYSTLNLLNEVNLRIANELKESGVFYVHGFPIPSLTGVRIFPRNATLQVLRIMNGNPHTHLNHIRELLRKIITSGKKLGAARIGAVETRKDIRKTALFQDLIVWLETFLEGTDHISIVYGSSIYKNRLFKSDIDLMTIASDSFCTSDNKQNLKDKVVELHKKYSLPLDEEIPFERKLLVPLSFALRSLNGIGFELRQHKVLIQDIVKTHLFLSSDVMLARLIVNALSTKNILLSGAFDLYHHLKTQAIRLVVWVILKQVASVCGPDELCDLLYKQGARAGEEFLGYKKSRHLDEYLRPVVAQTFAEMQSRQEIVSLNKQFMLSQAFDFSQILALQRALGMPDGFESTSGALV
jgi:L-2,4-diaminobutyrate decarboxylase